MDFWLLILGCFLAVNSMVGLVGNLTMVAVTIKTKTMRSACHILISLNCLADALHLCGQFPYAVTILLQVQITQAQCYYIEMIPLVGALSGCFLCLSLGFDRFLAVFVPSKYRQLEYFKTSYVFVLVLPPLIYTCWLHVMAFNDTMDDIFIPACSIPPSLNNRTMNAFSFSTMLINGITITMYLITWFILRSRKLGKNFQAVFKSIFVTVLFVVFGWALTMGINSATVFIKNDYVKTLAQFYAGFFVNISCAANVFIYYNISTEYKEAIQHCFGHVKETPLNVDGRKSSRKSISTVTAI